MRLAAKNNINLSSNRISDPAVDSSFVYRRFQERGAYKNVNLHFFKKEVPIMFVARFKRKIFYYFSDDSNLGFFVQIMDELMCSIHYQIDNSQEVQF